MGKYLYLLPFKENTLFKIGISSNDFSRVNYLNSLYNVNLEKSLIINASEKLINLIEKELLCVFPQRVSGYDGLDGHTEIRSIDVWDSVIEIIKLKQKYSDIKIENFNSLFVPKEVVAKKHFRSKEEILLNNSCEQRLMDVELLFQTDCFKNTFDTLDVKNILFDEERKSFTVFFNIDISLNSENAKEFVCFETRSLFQNLSLNRNKTNGGCNMGCTSMRSSYENGTNEMVLRFEGLFEHWCSDFKYYFVLLDIYETIYSLYLDFKNGK